MEIRTWLAAGCLLGVGWMALGSVAQSRAADLQVEGDGWRPKWQPVPIDSAVELPTARPAAPSAPAAQLETAATAEEVPFDWRDDLYGGPVGGAAGSDAASLPVNRSSPAAPFQSVACRWCQCQQSDPRLCGHCGLPRPVQAAYREAQPAREGPRTMLAGDEPTVPAVDRLRLALEQLNDRFQQTLGQF